MNANHLCLEIGNQCLPFLPTASCRYVEGSKQLTSQTVDAHLYATTAQTTCHTGCKGAWEHTTEVNCLKFDIVAVMNISNINANIIVLLCLHSLRERHGLCLSLLIRVERADRLNAFFCRHNLRKCAVVVVLEFLNSNTTTESATARQLSCMIEEIVVSLEFGNTGMIGKRTCIA